LVLAYLLLDRSQHPAVELWFCRMYHHLALLSTLNSDFRYFW
jgi:hypothetical protein